MTWHSQPQLNGCGASLQQSTMSDNKYTTMPKNYPPKKFC